MSEREAARSDCGGEQRPLPAFHPPTPCPPQACFFLSSFRDKPLQPMLPSWCTAVWKVTARTESVSTQGCGCWSSSLKNRLRSGQAFVTGLRARLPPPNSCPPASYSPSPLCPPPTWRLWKRLTPLLSKIKCCLSALKPSNTEQVIRFPQVFTFNFSTLLTL